MEYNLPSELVKDLNFGGDAKAKASNNNPLVDTNTVTPDIVRTSGGSINTTTYRPTTYGYGKY